MPLDVLVENSHSVTGAHMPLAEAWHWQTHPNKVEEYITHSEPAEVLKKGGCGHTAESAPGRYWHCPHCMEEEREAGRG